MNPKFWISIVIFISSYSPLAVILIINDFNFEKNIFNHKTAVITIFLIAVFSIIMLFLTIKNVRAGHRITVKKVGNRSNELVNYTIPYIISFYGLDFGKIPQMLSFLFFMLLMCILTIRTQSLFMNPILALGGYGLYNVKFDENGRVKEGVFLTNKNLEEENSYEIMKISKFLYLVTR